MKANSWGGIDSYISTCKKLNLKILANLLSWMDVHSLEQWLKFVEIIVSRYKGKIDAYEIFNEQDAPTSGSIWPTHMKFHENPGLYAEFLTVSYNLIKRIDPNAIVVMGGTTALDDGSYIEKILEIGGKCDAIAAHFYGTLQEINTRLTPKILRLKLLNKPIWITEAGQDSYLGIDYQI